MPWYKTGTVSVVQNSNAVIGTGTAFIANSRVGDGFRGPDGGWYEVVNIASDTALSISPNYQGATNAAGGYALAPLQGYVKDSADALRAIVNTYGTKLAALGTTGNYDLLPISKGGTGGDTPATARTGLGLGTAAVADLTINYADTTPGRAMKVGCCGIGLTTAIVNVDAELPSGIYQAAATGGGTYPAGFNNGSVIVTQRNASPYRGNQILVSDADGKMWRRANGGTWSSWVELVTAGANSNITSLSGLSTALSVEQGGTGATTAAAARSALGVPGKNLIINGDFQVNQRGYAGGATATAGAYTYDRWQVLTSGQSAPASASATGPGSVITAPAGGIMQPIEAGMISAGVHSLSWAGTATALVTQDNNPLVQNLAVGKGGQVTLIANQIVRLKFSSGTVGDVQLESGSVSTPFERLHVGYVTQLCQRYFEIIECATLGYGLTSQLVGGAFGYKVRKRVTPTATLYRDGALIANVNVGALGQQVYADQIIVYRNVAATGETRWHEGYYISAEIA